MFEADSLTVMVVVLLAGLVVYRMDFFRKKSVGYFTLMQVFTLMLIPGLLFPLLYGYMQAIVARPLNPQALLPDRFLENVTLLSLLFTYGGVAIHEVTKLQSRPDFLRYEESKAAELNRYFHLQFSHNLSYASSLLAIVSLMLLELNHIPDESAQSIGGALFKGGLLGFSFLAALWIYTRSEDEYSGRWYDLRWVFGVVWLVLMGLLYVIRAVDPVVSDYDLLLPAMVSLGGLALLSMVLVVRRVRRGDWSVRVQWERLRDLWR